MLKPFLRTRINYSWQLGLTLILVFGFLRIWAVRYGIESGNNSFLSVVFIAMALLPFLLLSKSGRKQMGIRRIQNPLWIPAGFLVGAVSCLLIYAIGQLAFGDTMSNWFRYIGSTYPLDFETVSDVDRKIYFWIIAGIGMTFSPFGEELLYRGLVHDSLAQKWSERTAAMLDSLAFGLTHLIHFGWVFHAGEWQLLSFPAICWVALMFATGLVFNLCKSMSNSIWGAVIAHMGFNLTMTFCIFYLIY